MPRTLPWLKDQAATKNRPSAAPLVKRQRLSDQDSEGSDNARSRQRVRAEQRREATKKAGRTPSTSPPAPPSTSPLRPGLAHDDIYIMVEDEFHSTASLYTSHLHHAEYVRLKNLAKARAQSSSCLPTTKLTVVEAARGTDEWRTGMRGETVQKRKLEGREKGNEEAVEGMRREARGAVAGSDSDDSNPNNRQGNEDEDEDEDEDEEDGVNAPWAGTSLHKLMAPIEKKNLTSLTGLQGIQSHTRAAKGYAKPDVGASPRKTLPQPISKTKRIEVQSARPKKVEFTTSRVVPQASGSSRGWQAKPPSVSASPDSSDLDALPPPRSKSSNPPASVSSKPSDPLTLAASDLFHPFQHRSRPHQPDPSSPPKILPSHYHHRRPNPNPELDNNNDDEEAVAAAAARRRLQMRRDREATVKKKGGMGMGARGRMDVKGNVDEIPVFLV